MRGPFEQLLKWNTIQARTNVVAQRTIVTNAEFRPDVRGGEASTGQA